MTKLIGPVFIGLFIVATWSPFLVVRGQDQKRLCKSSEWQCDDGTCIKLKLKCDGDPDCPDLSDEAQQICQPTTTLAPTLYPPCAKNQFQCGDGSCIKLKLKCDGGEPDCDDGSDEDPELCENYGQIQITTTTTTTTTTTPKPACPPSRPFHCHQSDHCIKLKLVCDGENDCENGEDEEDEEGSICAQNANNVIPAPSKTISLGAQQRTGRVEQEIENQIDGQQQQEPTGEEEFSLDDFPLVARTDEDDDVIRESLRLIQAGEEHIDDDERYRDIILMAGMSGSGKTTMTKFLSGDNTDLTSYPSSSGRFSIRDSEGRISSSKSTVVSKSIFPKMILNHQTNTAFFDLPGFGDTRGPSVDLANSVFIKKVADKARRLKIVFVVNYSSMRSGEAKSDFLNLLRHANSLIKSPAKYKTALALIANKVDVDVPGGNIVPSLAQFLTNVRSILPKLMADENEQQQGDSEIVENSRRLIDALLQKDRRGQFYIRLGYLRQPAAAGVLSDIPAFQNAKIVLNKIVMENTRFVAKATNDFGVSLSPHSKLFVRNAVGHLYINMALLTEELSGEIRNHFMNKFEQASNVYSLITDFRNELNFLTNKTNTMSTIIVNHGGGNNQNQKGVLGKKESSGRMDLLQILQEMAQAVEINDPDRVLSETMGRNLEHLDFLEPLLTDENRLEALKLSERVLESWTSPLKSALEDVENTIYNVAKMVNTWVASTLALAGTELQNLYVSHSEPIYDAISHSSADFTAQQSETSGDSEAQSEIKNFLEAMKADSKLLETLIQRLMTTKSIREFYNVTATFIGQLNVVEAPENLMDVLTLPPPPSGGGGDDLDFDSDFSLLDLPSKPSPYTPALWVVPLETLQSSLDETVQTMVATIRNLEQDNAQESLRDQLETSQAGFDDQTMKARTAVQRAEKELAGMEQEIRGVVERERQIVEDTAAGKVVEAQQEEEGVEEEGQVQVPVAK